MIASKPDDLSVAVEILTMRLHEHSNKKQPLSNTIILWGQELLLKIPISHNNGHSNNIVPIIEACFADDSARDNAKTLCIKLAQAFSNDEINYMDYGHVCESLAKKQPLVFLDVFLDDNLTDQLVNEVFSYAIEFKSNPLSAIGEDLIIEWCEKNPKIRYPRIASTIIPYRNNEEKKMLEWTALSLRMIANSPEPIVVLDKFKSKFRPMFWSGSRAEIMQKRLVLLSYLKKYENASVSEWACKEEKIFRQEIESIDKSEKTLEKSYEHFD